MAAFLRDSDDIALICHTAPDGDTLGSALGLMHMLEGMDKQVHIYCCDPVPAVYSFMPGNERILLPDGAPHHSVCVAVDCADMARLGRSVDIFSSAEHTAVIDHHPTNTRFADNCFIDDMAGAVGEMMSQLADPLGAKLTGDICACLYTAIMTDTGSFAYSNTSPETHIQAARLIAGGADPAELNRLVYRTVPYKKVRLLGAALSNAELHKEGRLGYTQVTFDDMRAAGATGEDTEGIIDHLRDIDTVELAVFLREAKDGSVKVSMRSKRMADVSAISSKLGGGGHMRAAGATLHCPISEAKETLLRLACEELDRIR